ncbi:Metallo-peptidase family M12-domain-containing protein [Dichotomopilus funicola]|uniref:Disintegrin and metalloproteinase domain-containing protein B n=1 Tax=Dichotomopilus funicola TaxID=1934379 RepID=A0AAN6V422_9PEZI|nr:Metallo-peptidase family M12-domain-containing protein [Dichotomopilus funicola]
MIFSKAFAAVVTAAGLLVQDAIAHSVKRNPLSSIARIEDAVIQTPSHRVHAHSSFDVSFVISTTQQKIRLALEPNHDILGPDATIHYLAADGSVRESKPIDRRGHRIFKGESFVRREGESGWTHVGWSRINVHRDGDHPVFDGVFTINGNHHHVQTTTAYRRSSLSGDPDLDDVFSDDDNDDEYMVLWRDTDVSSGHPDLKRDLGERAATCGSDTLEHNRFENNIVYRSFEGAAAPDTSSWQISPRALFGRQVDTVPGSNGAGVNLQNSIGSTAGCPTTRKVALVGIATDCEYTNAMGTTDDAVTKNVLQVINAASQLYESTFNISLALANLTISEPDCPSTPPAGAQWNRPCTDSATVDTRLSLFSEWRGQWKDGNAFWTLLSMCGTGSTVGLAWLGAVCQEGASTRGNETSASANVVVHTPTEWLVFAHETGHTFGAVHDCEAGTCTDGSVDKQECCPLSTGTCDAKAQFIMNPSTGNGITSFSPCSIGNICSFLGRTPNKFACLSSNSGVTTFTGAQCGNGIVEHGEDCDCGGEAGCAGNACCDANTCKFTTGSVCDPTNQECCTDQCGFATNGTICRASTGACDPQETCSGASAGCPADVTAPDGQSCGDNGLQCASGRCTSRDQQCSTFMGADTTSSCSSSGCVLSCHSSKLGPNQCYNLNQYFLDGTPCEGGGRCSNGNCAGTSLGQQILDWINNNKQISIPVICIAGGLVLLVILSCVWSCFSRCCRRSKPAAVPPGGASRRSGWGGGNPYFGAAAIPRGGGGRGGGPGPGRGYGPERGRGGGAYSPVPEQEMVGGAPPPYPPAQGQDGRWEPMRTRSFRYA